MAYQTFDDQAGASASSSKLARLHFPDLKGRSFLDLGCNEGFFCGHALRQGATRVVGIERNAGYYERAVQRFPDAVFYNQSWDDPIPGTYDVILFSSALHYSDRKRQLLAEILDLLNPEGLLVLECGIAPGEGLEEVATWRKVGTVNHVTRPLLMDYLRGYSVTEVGPSVNQSGDSAPRFVFHCRKRMLQTVVLLCAESGLGKSTLASNWPKEKTISLDYLMRQFQINVLGDTGSRLEVPKLLARIESEKLWEKFFSTIFEKIDSMSTIKDSILIDGFALAHPEVYKRFLRHFEGVAIWDLKPCLIDGTSTVIVNEELNLFELTPDLIEVPFPQYYQMRPDGKSFLLHPPSAGKISRVGWTIQSAEGKSRFLCELSLPHMASSVECVLHVVENGRAGTYATTVLPGEHRRWEVDLGLRGGELSLALQTELHSSAASREKCWLIVHSPRLST